MQPILHHYLLHFLVLKIPLLQFSLGVWVPEYDFSPSYPNFYFFPFLVWVVPFCFSIDSAIFQFLPLSCFIEHILSLESVWSTICLISLSAIIYWIFLLSNLLNYLRACYVPGRFWVLGYIPTTKDICPCADLSSRRWHPINNIISKLHSIQNEGTSSEWKGSHCRV